MWLGIDLSKLTFVELGIIGIYITSVIIVFSIFILPFIVIDIKNYFKCRTIDKAIELNYEKFYKQKWVLNKK